MISIQVATICCLQRRPQRLRERALFSPLFRPHPGAYFRELIEFEHGGEIRSFRKPSIGPLRTVL